MPRLDCPSVSAETIIRKPAALNPKPSLWPRYGLPSLHPENGSRNGTKGPDSAVCFVLCGAFEFPAPCTILYYVIILHYTIPLCYIMILCYTTLYDTTLY